MAIFIDLYGLPGSGKTTVANLISAECEKYDYHVYKMNGTPWGQNFKNNFRHKIVIGFLSVKYWKHSALILKLLAKHKILSAAALKRTFQIALYLSEIDWNSKHKNINTIIISDNGLFQTFVSSLYNTKKIGPDKKCLCEIIESILILNILNNVHFYRLKSNLELCISRIRNRKKEIRIKSLAFEELKLTLSYQNELFDYIEETIENFEEKSQRCKVVNQVIDIVDSIVSEQENINAKQESTD